MKTLLILASLTLATAAHAQDWDFSRRMNDNMQRQIDTQRQQSQMDEMQSRNTQRMMDMEYRQNQMERRSGW